MSAKRVLSVGQCSYDHGRLEESLSQLFGVEVVPVASAAEAGKRLQEERFTLVLVNRVFDADGASGIDFIRHMHQQPSPVPMMLVSNYEDAQKAATVAGALPGFGKAAIGQPGMRDCLRDVLGS